MDPMTLSPAIEVSPDQRRAAAMVLLAAACFASIPTFAQLAYENGVNPTGLLTVRFLAAAAIVLGALRVLRGPLRIARRGRGFALLVLLFAAQSFCFFTSVEENGAVRAVLLLYTYPMITTLAGAAWLGERLTAAKVGVLVVGFAGVALSVGPLSTSFSAAGLVLGFGSSVLFAATLLLAKRILAVHGDATEMMALLYAGAAVLYLGLAAVRGAALPAGAGGWAALAGVVLIGTVAAMGLFFAGLHQLPAGTTSMLGTLEPALSVLLAALVLGEAVGAVQALGIVLVLGSIFALTRLVTEEPKPVALEVIP